MKHEKKKLSNELTLFIEENVIDKDICKQTITIATKKLAKYFSTLKIDQIFKGNTPLERLSENELCNLARYLQENFNMQIDLSYWFTDDVIKESLNDYAEPVVSGDNLKFENTIFNGDASKPIYKTFITWKQLADLVGASKLRYNVNTQRIGEYYSRGYKTATVPKLEGESIDNIAKLVSDEKFGSNDIILNILREDDTNPFEYNGNTLVVKSETLDILDGAHRTYGIYDGVKLNPHAEGSIGVTILNLDIEEAGNLVYQVATTNEHNRELLGKYDATNKATQFIKKLNYSLDGNFNFLYKKIDQFNSKDKDKAIIKDGTLRKTIALAGIEKYLKETSLSEMNDLVDYTIEFYTALIEKFQIKYPNHELLRSDTFLSFLMFSSYTAYKKQMRISSKTMEKIVERFNFEETQYNHKQEFTIEEHRIMKDIFENLVKGIK
ncbi:MAG: hypothetical protein ACRDD7_09480 [Peptostreptococcaceae bacterium]